MSEEKYENDFQVSQAPRLHVSNIRGSVEILAGEAGKLRVTAVKNTESGDGKGTKVQISQDADGTVRVITHFPEGGWNWLFGTRPCTVDYVIQVPPQATIQVNTVSSRVSVTGLAASCGIKTVSGDIDQHALMGVVHIHTISGDVEGTGIAGSLELETISGDVTLQDSSLASMNAKTVSGELTIQTPLTVGPYTFKSISGDVRLRLPSETRCTAELHSVSGRLNSAFPGLDSYRDHGYQSVAVQDGGVPVTLNSVSGNLSLESSGEIPAPRATTPATPAVDRRGILEGIERGELSVDEALTRLKS